MEESRYNLYWGELHTHTFCGGGSFGVLEEAAAIARTHLDFWAPGEHQNLEALFDWEEVRSVVAQHHQPGRFVTFPAFEYAGRDGDYNVYLKQDLKSLPEIRNHDDFFKFVRKQQAIAIPHHLGYKVGCRGMRWEWFDVSIMPLVEIFSMHGSSENDEGMFPLTLPFMAPREAAGTAIKGLMRGNVFGFIASSDGHSAYPGAYKMGLVAAYATELTRESLWDAFWARRTYAVTGDRIVLDFRLNGHFMGEECPASGERHISLSAVGLDTIDRMEIIKNGRVLLREPGRLSSEGPLEGRGKFKVRLEWGWGQCEKLEKWKGLLQVKGGSILSTSPCFGPPGPNEILSVSNNAVSWVSRTDSGSIFSWQTGRYEREGTNSIVFTIQGDEDTQLELELNQHRFRYSMGQLGEGSRVELVLGPFDPKVKFHQPTPEELDRISCEEINRLPKVKFHRPVPEEQYTRYLETVDTPDEGTDKDFYYARVIQANGQVAWSSPIWVESKASGDKR